MSKNKHIEKIDLRTNTTQLVAGLQAISSVLMSETNKLHYGDYATADAYTQFCEGLMYSCDKGIDLYTKLKEIIIESNTFNLTHFSK